MKFEADRKQLQLAVQRCLNIVDPRAHQACLANILLRTDGDAVELVSTNLEISISTRMSAEVAKQGAVTVSAHTLFDLLREWGSVDRIQLVLEGDRLELRSGRSLMRLNTIPAGVFPAIHTAIEGGTEVALPAVVLSEMIASTQFSLSNDITRLYLTGLLFECGPDHSLRLVSTDGHRMSFCQFPLTDPPSLDAPLQVVVPKKTVAEFKRLCDECDGRDATLTLHRRHVFLRVGVHVVSSKTIDASYPHYQDVLPESASVAVQLPRREFDQVLRRCMVLANEFTHDIRTTFVDNALHVETVNKEQEQAEDFLACPL